MPPLELIKQAESVVGTWLLEAAEDKTRFKGDVINWADLRVIECLWDIDSIGDAGFAITISEADCVWRLEEYLLAKWKLSAFASHDVRFLFEW